MKVWARFRRWLHLMGHLLELPFVWLTTSDPNARIEVHRATDRYEPPTLPTRLQFIFYQRHVEMGCTCGKVFWKLEHGEGPHK